MSKLRVHFLWPIVMLGSLVAFTGAVFAADTPADPTTDPQGALSQFWQSVVAKKWGLAAVIGTMLLVALVRFIAPRLHDKFGAWILTTRVSAALALVAGMLSSISTQLMKGGTWSMSMLTYGFMFGVGAIGGYNAFWDLIFPNDRPKDSTAKLAIPPPIRPGVLLPFVFIGAALTMSCAHMTPDEKAFGTAYGACMEAKGLAVAPGVGQEAWDDLNGRAATDGGVTTAQAIVAQLEALAKRAGVDAVTCAVQAWTTAPVKGTRNPAGVEASKTYLKAHGA